MPGRAGRADNEILKSDNIIKASALSFIFIMTILIESAYLGNFYETSNFIRGIGHNGSSIV